MILASASPRRRELLHVAGIGFRPAKSKVDENKELMGKRKPNSYAVHLAKKKACDVAARNTGKVVVGADTLVVVGRKVLGKPENLKDAREMVGLLSGRWHKVITGVAVIKGGRLCTGVEMTRVKFRRMTAREIEEYVTSGEPLDKAGGYAIQGRGRAFVEKIAGDYTNVVGLPLNLMITLLSRLQSSNL